MIMYLYNPVSTISDMLYMLKNSSLLKWIKTNDSLNDDKDFPFMQYEDAVCTTEWVYTIRAYTMCCGHQRR